MRSARMRSSCVRSSCITIARKSRCLHTFVVPAEAGTHFDFAAKAKMDPGFRRDDDVQERSTCEPLDETEYRAHHLHETVNPSCYGPAAFFKTRRSEGCTFITSEARSR